MVSFPKSLLNLCRRKAAFDAADGNGLHDPDHSAGPPNSSGLHADPDHNAGPPNSNGLHADPDHSAGPPTVGLFRKIGTHLSNLLRPEYKLGAEPTWASSFSAIVRASWLNVLLLFVPISWALHYFCHDTSQTHDSMMFVFSCLALIPLAKLLGFATEELALRVGETVGGLLRTTFENAMEVIVATTALVKCELAIVQSLLAGSILCNLLLGLGSCFVVGGTRFSNQGFFTAAARLNRSLLTLSVVAVLIPAASQAVTSSADFITHAPNAVPAAVLKMSRSVSVILLFIYASYLVFLLWFPVLIDDESVNEGAPKAPAQANTVQGQLHSAEAAEDTGVTGDPTAASATLTADVEPGAEVGKREHAPVLNLGSSIILVIVVVVLVAVTVQFHSIHGLTEYSGSSVEWIGLILLPISSHAQHLTALKAPPKEKLALILDLAIGSSTQILLFVMPLLVVIAWIMDKPLPLLVDPFEIIALFLAVITVNHSVAARRSNWLEGVILMCLYVIVGTAFFFYKPNTALQAALHLTCGTLIPIKSAKPAA